MSGVGTEQSIEEAGGLQNPVCEIQMQKIQNPNTLGTPVNFVHTDNGPEVDVITAGVTEFFRDAAQSIYNIAVEGFYTNPTSPQNTEWNSVYTDAINNGHANIQNLQSRTYGDFYTALNSSIGNFVLTTPLVMHDLITDKYYLFTFTQWTSGGGGGGFQYTRTEVVIGSVICSGRIYFDDGTWIDTAPTSGTGTPFRVAMFNSAGNGLTESLIECSPVTNVGTNVLTGSVDCLVVGNNISAINASTSFIYGSNSNIDNASECFVVGHNNVDFSGASSVFSCIVLGNLTTFLGDNAGVYSLGDTNAYNNVSYSAVFGQNNTVTSTSFSTINGAYNILTTSTGTTIVGRSNSVTGGSNSTLSGYANSINNPNTSSVFGHQNVIGASLNSTVLLGKSNNSSALVAGNVHVLNTNFGLKITTAFAGIGGAGFNPTVKWHVKGTTSMLGTALTRFENAVNNASLLLNDDGNLYLNSPQFTGFQWQVAGVSAFQIITTSVNAVKFRLPANLTYNNKTNDFISGGIDNGNYFFQKEQATVPFVVSAKVHIRGIDNATNYAVKVESDAGTNLLSVRNDGRINVSSLPVSNVGLIAGDLWNNGGVVNIV